MNTASRHAGNNTEVTLSSRGFVIITLHGAQTVEGMRRVAGEVEAHAKELHTHNKKMLLCLDLRALDATDVSSEVRMASRQMLKTMPADALAVVGNNRAATSVLYLLRAVRSDKHVRFFTNEHRAQSWLEEMRHPKQQRLTIGLVSGIALLTIGISVLIGWQMNNAYLTSWVLALRPMNPLSAVALCVIGTGLICHWARKLDWLHFLGCVGILFGAAALLPLHIDYLLYGGRLSAVHGHVAVADSAALCFIAIGILALIAGRKERWVRPVEYGAVAITGALAVGNIFGQLYAREYMYSLGNFAMALNLAVALALATATLLLLVMYRQKGGNVLRQMSLAGWCIVSALLVVQITTYGIWMQTIDRNNNEAHQALLSRSEDIRALMVGRLQAYTNSIRGFSGLYKASDYVSKQDFSQYYASLNLEHNYPGLQSLVYISAVNDKDVPNFIATMRHNGVNTGDAPFMITPKVNTPKHFILTYVAGGTTVNAGLDLSSIPGRQQLYGTALASKGIYGSGTVTIPSVGGQKSYQGFFITTPVETANSSQPIGIVNAVLKYDLFFASVFGDSNLLQDTDVRVTDAGNHKAIFSTHRSSGAAQYTTTATVPIENQRWNITVSVNKQFGVGASQTRLPLLTLAVGQAFSLFLLLLFLMQARGRKQALELADTITKDLQIERNRAVTNDQKSLAILESIGDGVFAIDTKKRLTLLNPVAETIAGVQAAEVIGRPYDQVLHFEFEKSGAVNDRFIRQALKGHMASMSSHTVINRRDGKHVPVADSAAPIRDARGKILGAIVVFRDVSKDYELDKAKTEFVSLASHQLRTPLSAINWYGEMLLNGDAGTLNKDQHEYIQEIFEGSQRMVELVNSLLDVSRLEVGKLNDQPAPTNMRELVESLEKELHTSVQAKQLTLATHIESLPPVIADPKQLRMIVQNLMSNAVKYTADKGTVDVILRPATARDMVDAGLHGSEPHWFFAVQDNGYGIPKEQQAKIFGKLFRADNVRTLDVEGTGLGLYIVKEVVQKMGGRVWFESTESVGTTFFVVSPVQPPHHKGRV